MLATPLPTTTNFVTKRNKMHSRHAIEALAISLYMIPGVRAVGYFGKPETRHGATSNPKIILGMNGWYHPEKFSNFIQRNKSRILKYDRGTVTRAAATYTFESLEPSFQGILANYESEWCNGISDNLEVYILPLDWPKHVEKLKEMFTPFTPKEFWECAQETARLIG